MLKEEKHIVEIDAKYIARVKEENGVCTCMEWIQILLNYMTLFCI